MPSKKIGNCTWYTYLTPGEERLFWHEQRNSPGVAITARDRLAVQQGKKVTVKIRKAPPPPDLPAANSEPTRKGKVKPAQPS